MFKAKSCSNAATNSPGPLFKLPVRISTHLLPAGYEYSHVKLDGLFSGPLTNLNHQVTIQLRELITPQTAPLNLEASWSAKMAVFEDFMLRAQAGPAILVASGSGSLEGGKTNITLRDLKLSKGDELYLALDKPFRISLSQGENARTPLAELEPIIWKGREKNLILSGEFEWPMRGNLNFAATNINPELFQFF